MFEKGTSVSISIIILLFSILVATLPSSGGLEDVCYKDISGIQKSEINKSIIQGSLKNVTELEMEERMKGSVSFNETDYEIDIYHIETKDRWTFFDVKTEVFLSSKSRTNETVYLEIHDKELNVIDRWGKLKVTNESGDWFELKGKYIDGNDCYLVVYGSGNYSIFIRERLDDAFLVSIFATAFVIIVIMSIVFKVIYKKLDEKYNMIIGMNRSHLESIKLTGKKIDFYHNLIEKNSKDLRITKYISRACMILMLLELIIYIIIVNGGFSTLFHFFMFDSFIFPILLILFIIIIVSAANDHVKNLLKKKRQWILKWKKKTEVKNQNYPPNRICERYFLYKDFFFHTTLILVFIILSLYHILTDDPGFLAYNLSVLSLYLLLVSTFFPISIFQSMVYVECTPEEIMIIKGPKLLFKITGVNGHRIKRDHIKSIRPIPASLYYNILPGVTRVNGSFHFIRNGISIERSSGDIEEILTSKPMEILRLISLRGESK